MRIVNNLLLYAEEHKDDGSRSVLCHLANVSRSVLM